MGGRCPCLLLIRMGGTLGALIWPVQFLGVPCLLSEPMCTASCRLISSNPPLFSFSVLAIAAATNGSLLLARLLGDTDTKTNSFDISSQPFSAHDAVADPDTSP